MFRVIFTVFVTIVVAYLFLASMSGYRIEKKALKGGESPPLSAWRWATFPVAPSPVLLPLKEHQRRVELLL
jgi:hypothetical protein